MVKYSARLKGSTYLFVFFVMFNIKSLGSASAFKMQSMNNT